MHYAKNKIQKITIKKKNFFNIFFFSNIMKINHEQKTEQKNPLNSKQIVSTFLTIHFSIRSEKKFYTKNPDKNASYTFYKTWPTSQKK